MVDYSDLFGDVVDIPIKQILGWNGRTMYVQYIFTMEEFFSSMSSFPFGTFLLGPNLNSFSGQDFRVRTGVARDSPATKKKAGYLSFFIAMTRPPSAESMARLRRRLDQVSPVRKLGADGKSDRQR